MSREKPTECDCCGFETDKLTLYANAETTIGGSGKTIREDFWYCDLCAGSNASVFSRYHGQAPSNSEVIRAICYVGNAIIAALEPPK